MSKVAELQAQKTYWKEDFCSAWMKNSENLVSINDLWIEHLTLLFRFFDSIWGAFGLKPSKTKTFSAFENSAGL